jgi:hypothetical protein
MFRLWVKIYKNNKITKDYIAQSNNYNLSRTKMIFSCLEEACHELDLASPIWLELNIKDFQLHSKTRFSADNFIEATDFDYLEVQILDE